MFPVRFNGEDIVLLPYKRRGQSVFNIRMKRTKSLLTFSIKLTERTKIALRENGGRGGGQ